MVKDVFCADWAPDGQTLAVVRRAEEDEARLEFPIGNVLYKLPQEKGSITALRVSPQADRVAFLEMGTGQTFSLAVVNLGGQRQTLSTGWNRTVGVAWTGSGDEVWFAGTRVGFARALYAVSLSGRERLVTRVPGPLTLQDLAPDGRVLLTHENTRREMAGMLAGDVRERDLSWLDYSWPHDLSADGHRLLFAEGGGVTRQKPVLFLRTDAAPPVRLGEIETSANARLSPDGKWVLFFGGSSLERMPTGAGRAQPIPIGPIELPTDFARFFPDGKRILVSGHEPGHKGRTYVVDLEGGTPRPITPEGIQGGPISPDSEWLFALEESSGKFWVFPIRGGDPVPIKGQLEPGSRPLEWSPDGRSQWRFRGDGLPGRISRFDRATAREQPWKELMPADPAGIRTIDRTLISPDGKHYVYSFLRVLSDLYLVEGLK